VCFSSELSRWATRDTIDIALVNMLAPRLAVGMIEAGVKPADVANALNVMVGTNFPDNQVTIGLALSMATAKCMTDPCMNVPYSTIVTCMTRNGVDFGIRISGLGDEFFTAPANKPFAAMMFEEYNDNDMGCDMGDSAITEAVGWGGLILAGAPSFTQLFCKGVTYDMLTKWHSDMRKITTAESEVFKMPVMDGKGVPLGIDLLKVIETGIVPLIDTGMAHKLINRRVIGRGLVWAPMGCFEKAFQRFVEKFGRPLTVAQNSS